jgi:putative membrane protein
MSKPLSTAMLVGVVASIPASKIKALTERPLQRAAEALWPPTLQDKELVGADPTGHPENMPPAVLAGRVASRLGHEPLAVSRSLQIQNVVHYGFGALSGVAYGILACTRPSVTVGAGSGAGAAIYLAGHGTALPLLRVQAPPWHLPRAAFAWEFASHLLFGLVLEYVRRSATTLLTLESPA